MKRAALVALAGVVLALVVGAATVTLVTRWQRLAAPARPEPPAMSAATTTAPKIRARLFYVAEDGMRLMAVEREVPLGATPIEQARLLVTEQLAAAPPPLVQAIPEATALRALFLTERGEAFVDLSREVRSRHPGGSLDELFTVYAIVNVLTVNLPAVTKVQILVDGKEVDTLAGHIDLREPLARNLRWVEEPASRP